VVKQVPVPLTKEEMNKLIEASIDDEFFYMLFNVAKKTGRRLGEYYGIPKKILIGSKNKVDKYGKQISVPVYKNDSKEYEGGVKVKDIDEERKVMMTQVLKRRQRITKEALLDDDTLMLIKRYVKREGLTLDDYLFRKYSYRTIQNKVKHYTKKAGIQKNISFHNFRHYFITELFKKGWHYSQIAKLTGHSSVGTLATYDHSVASDLRDKAMNDIKDI